MLSPSLPVLFGIVAGLAAARNMLRMRRLRRRIAAAIDADDSAAFRVAYAAFVRASMIDDPRVGSRRRLLEVIGPLLDGDWASVRALIGEIDPDRLTRPERVQLENVRAYTLAHDGEAELAVSLAQAAVEHARGHAPKLLPSCMGTLGIVLALARRPAEALAPLQTALAGVRIRRSRTGYEFYLGEALRALGRTDEAHAAYARAAALHPTSRYGKRAAARLSEPSTPYR